jgi:hypothetical protein
MDDSQETMDISPSQAPSFLAQTLGLSPTPPQTPAAPLAVPTSIPRRPKKKANPNPIGISEELAEFDDKLDDAFDKFAELVNQGIHLVHNETDKRFFYGRLQQLKDNFDTLIILRDGGKRRKTTKNKKSKTKSKTRRTK